MKLKKHLIALISLFLSQMNIGCAIFNQKENPFDREKAILEKVADAIIIQNINYVNKYSELCERFLCLNINRNKDVE